MALYTYCKDAEIAIPILNPVKERPSLGPNTIMLRAGVEQGVRGNAIGDNVLLSGERPGSLGRPSS